MEHDFEDIEIKENAIELLENALRRKRKKCMLGTGSIERFEALKKQNEAGIPTIVWLCPVLASVIRKKISEGF